jgi:hypothetical protein
MRGETVPDFAPLNPGYGSAMNLRAASPAP